MAGDNLARKLEESGSDNPPNEFIYNSDNSGKIVHMYQGHKPNNIVNFPTTPDRGNSAAQALSGAEKQSANAGSEHKAAKNGQPDIAGLENSPAKGLNYTKPSPPGGKTGSKLGGKIKSKVKQRVLMIAIPAILAGGAAIFENTNIESDCFR